MRNGKGAYLLLIGYSIYVVAPLYWLFTMAVRTNQDILGEFEIIPGSPTLANFVEIFTTEAWYSGFVNSLTYVTLNTVISIVVASPRLAISVPQSSCT